MAGQAMLNYSSAHRYLMDTLVQAWPEKKWLRPLALGTSLLALGADVAISSHFARQEAQDGETDLHDRLAELYRREADKLTGQPLLEAAAQSSAAAQAQSIVQVNLGLPAAPPAFERQTSRYLMEEGAPIETDCFSCATAHLAGGAGALQRAQFEIQRTGACGPECQEWLHLAAQEPSALLARDWTPEKVARFPQEQQDLIRRLAPEVLDVQRRIVGDPQRQALVQAAAELKEATRFTRAGDGLDHPEVERRLASAEASLVEAERLRVGTFDPETANDLRHLRQDVGSRIASPEDLLAAADRADEIARRANAEVYGRLRPEDVSALADQMSGLRETFRSERRRLAPQGFHALRAPVPLLPAPGGARVNPNTVLRFTAPSAAEAAAVTDATSLGDLRENLTRHLEERGTRVVVRNLEASADGSLEGYYDPDGGNIVLSSAVGLQDTPYSFEVRVHEAAHSLLDSNTCNPRPSLSHDREEERAELATIAAMTELGLPIELYGGGVLPPGSREVDWEHIERFDPGLARDARWAADWISTAARDQQGHLAMEICPALRG